MYKAVFLMTDWDYVMMLCLTQQYCIRCVSVLVLCARINLFDMYPKTANRVHV